MYLNDHKWLVTSLLLPIITGGITIAQAGDEASTISVVGNALEDSKVKSLSEPLEVRYSLQNVNNVAPVDVYIAVLTPNNGFWFLQPAGTFVDTPQPYYQNLTQETSATVLKLNLPNDFSLIGENTFYAALLPAKTDATHVPLASLPWEKLALDTVFLTRIK